jgi:hypothetical protein
MAARKVRHEGLLRGDWFTGGYLWCVYTNSVSRAEGIEFQGLHHLFLEVV